MNTEQNFTTVETYKAALSVTKDDGEEKTWEKVHAAICDVMEQKTVDLSLFDKIYGDSLDEVLKAMTKKRMPAKSQKFLGKTIPARSQPHASQKASPARTAP